MQYGPHMMPMGGRNYKQAHQGGRGGGRGGGGGGGGGNAAAAAGGSSSGTAPAAEGSSPGSASGGAGRGTGRGASQEPPKHAGLTIHRAGAGSGPVRSRPQSAVEPRSTPPEPFDNEVTDYILALLSRNVPTFHYAGFCPWILNFSSIV